MPHSPAKDKDDVNPARKLRQTAGQVAIVAFLVSLLTTYFHATAIRTLSNVVFMVAAILRLCLFGFDKFVRGGR
ncbi:hypothetical protein GCM10009765_51680 [Fodinicola feengrottensis]|uniref:Uncharacterized protein n=1 Tax=Fodinicola feengrottensis TaxID=435914 RepID=A0ABN2HZE7_9ACTN